MAPSQTLELCSCSVCSKLTWKDQEGRIHRGSFQKKGVIRMHLMKDKRDALRTQAGSGGKGLASAEEPDESHIADAILLSTMTDTPPPPGEFAPSRSKLRTSGNAASHNLANSQSVESRAATSSKRQDAPSQKRKLAAEPPTGQSSEKRQKTNVSIMDSQSEIGGPMDEDSAGVSRVLTQIRGLIAVKKSRVSQYSRLKFQSPPAKLEDPPAALDWSDYASQQVDAYLGWLESSLVEVRKLSAAVEHGLQSEVEEELLDELRRVADWKAAQWDEQRALAGLYGGVSPQVHSSAPLEVSPGPLLTLPIQQPWIFAVLISITALSTLSSFPRDNANLLLKVIRLLIFGALTWQQTQLVGWSRWDASVPELSPDQRSVVNSVPVDVRTVTKRLGLEPEYTLYACCPKCFATYAPIGEGKAQTWPKLCTHRPTPADQPCGADLLKPGGDKGQGSAPKKQFPLHSLRHWLSQLLAREGVEDLLDKAWDVPPGCEEEWADIMHAPGVREFKGPDRNTLFSVQPDGTYHLVFSLFIDWFNPFGNKAAGKSHSIGAIYMVCLNLPPEMRYLTENIFLVGIIPGPREPSQEEINHLLRPLIDELLVFWERGVHVSKTAKRPYGYNVLAAVIPLICDLPAARKTAGFSGHSSMNVCSFCDIRKDELNDLDREGWRRKNYEEHVVIARGWRDAPDQHTRELIFEEFGIRWSEMLRLPYWDPTRYTVVDAMHNLYLGELKHHCEKVFGILDGEPLDEDKKNRPHTPQEQREWLKKVAEGLSQETHKPLVKARKGYLVAFATLNSVAVHGETKEDYAIALHQWYKAKPLDVQVSIPEPLAWNTSDFKLLNSAEELSRFSFIRGDLLARIREDISETTFPSWINRPPRNFGSPAAGKLTADQWRTVATTCMVISLVRSWSSSTVSAGHRNMLKNYMLLVTAVLAATSKTMSKDRARFYDSNMHEYLSTLRELYDHDLVPNHHMALHLGECLERFGPVQSWWAFPFERYNGIIAKINTNNKSADMPVTFLRNFCIGANLRALMSRVPWPKHTIFREFVKSFNEIIGDALRGLPGISPASNTASTYNPQEATELPKEVYNALLLKLNSPNPIYSSAYDSRPTNLPTLARHAHSVQKATIAGMDFTCGGARRGESNSYVAFKEPSPAPGGVQTPDLAGKIHSIFHHARKEGTVDVVETFFVVQRFLPLPEKGVEGDLYRVWEGLQAKAFLNKLDAHIYICRQNKIVSHFMSRKLLLENVQGECVIAFRTPTIVHR